MGGVAASCCWNNDDWAAYDGACGEVSLGELLASPKFIATPAVVFATLEPDIGKVELLAIDVDAGGFLVNKGEDEVPILSPAKKSPDPCNKG